MQTWILKMMLVLALIGGGFAAGTQEAALPDGSVMVNDGASSFPK